MPASVRSPAALGILLVLVAVLLLLLLLLLYGRIGSPSVPTAASSTPPSPAANEPAAGTAPSPASPEGALREAVTGGPGAPPATAGEAATGALCIRVVDAADAAAPIPGIGVIVRESWQHGPRPPRQHFRTDVSGQVRAAGLRPGRFFITTDRHIGICSATVTAGQETDVTLTIEDGIGLRGTVVDSDGVGVANASVILGGWAGEEPTTMATTDAEGRFSIRPVRRVGHVTARAKGYAPAPYRLVTAGAGAEVEVKIVLDRPGGGVAGQVLDPEGRGVADALVGLGVRPPYGVPITLPDGQKGMHPPRPEVVTDAAGRFRAEGLEPGPGSPVTVRSDSFAPWSGTIAVVAQQTMPIVIRLSRGVACEGEVRDQSGRPLAGINVQHGTHLSVGFRQTRTALDGRYRLEALPADKTIKVGVHGDRHGSASKEMQGRAGETLQWDVTLSRGLVLEGRVLGKGGEALPGVMVRAHASDPAAVGQGWRPYARTDATGRFELIGCPAGPVINLQVQARAHADLHRQGVDAATVGPLVLQMESAGESARIVGRLLDPDGKPVADALIQVGHNGGGGGSVYTPSSTGGIEIEGLRPGLCTVRIQAGAHVHVSAEHDLGSGETWDLGPVRLARSGRLGLELERAPGAEKALITAVIYRRDLFLAALDRSKGSSKEKLVSGPLAPGDYELLIGGPQIVPAVFPFAIEADRTTRLRVRAQAGVSVKLEFVLPPAATDARRLRITITGAGGFRHQRTVRRWPPRPFGVVRIALDPGRYTLRARSDQGHETDSTFAVEPGEVEHPREFRFELK